MNKSQRTKKWRKEHRHSCQECGKLVDPRSTRCCKCNNIYRFRKYPKRVCQDCGKPPANMYAKRCMSCYLLYHRVKEGTRNMAGQGYIKVYQPGHPRAYCSGYVQEHILIWEQTHGKPVPKGWEVHHYNGIKDDNRPSNLFAKSKREHRLIIPELQKRIQELEGLLKNQGQLL